MTSIPGFPSLCIFCCMQNRDVLGDSTFSPSETLLSINFLSLNLAIKLLTVLFSVVGSCSKCLWCSMSFNCFADPLLQSFISSITAAPPLLAFVMKISSRNFSSFNPFCFFPFFWGGDRLVYLHALTVLSSSLTLFFLILFSFYQEPTFIGSLSKNLFLCLFFDFSVVSKISSQFYTPVKIIHFFIY